MNDEQHKTLLLVEDEVIIAMNKQKELEKYGYNVITVNTGEKAVLISKENGTIDLILMDIDLGHGIDGTVAAERILNNRGIPVLFLSSHAEPEVVEKTEKITSYGYVIKNSSITVLDASIKMAFKLFEANRLSEEHQRHLETTLNSIGDAVIAIDESGNISSMNPIAERLTGWNFKMAFGIPVTQIFKIIDTESREPVENPVKKVLDNGETGGLNSHSVLVAGNGREYHISVSAAPMINSDGGISGAVLVFRDISEEFGMQESLRESEERYRLLAENSDDLLWTCDTMENNFNMKYINPAVKEMLGYTEKEFMQMPIEGRMTPKSLYTINNAYAEFMHTDNPVHFQIQHIHKSGRLVDCELWVKPIYNGKGHIAGLQGRSIDITERNKVEGELRESKKMLDDVINSIPVRVFWKDLDGVYLGCNHLFARDAGKGNPEEVIGSNDHNMGWADQAEKYRCKDRNVIQNSQIKISYEELLTISEGESILLNTTKVALRHKEGDMYGVLGIYEDITDRKQVEKQLKESEEKFSKAFHSNPTPMQIINIKTGERLDINESCLRLFESERDEYLQGNMFQNNQWTNQELFKIGLEKLIKDKSVKDYPIEIITKSGKVKNLLASGSLLDGSDGDLVIGAYIDITDRKKED